MRKKRIYLYLLVFALIFRITAPAYADIYFKIDRVDYKDGTASIYSSISSDVYEQPAGKEVKFEIYDNEGKTVDFSPKTMSTGSEPTSVSEEVYCYELDTISFIPMAGSVSYAVYASIEDTSVGTGEVVPRTTNTLTSFSIGTKVSDINNETKLIFLPLPEDMPVGEYPVAFAHDGSYMRMNGSIINSGDSFLFTDSDTADPKWDSVTVAVYGENNKGNIYCLDIVQGKPGDEPEEWAIDSWKFVKPSDDSELNYSENAYLFYKGIESKEVAKVKVELKEGKSAAITAELCEWGRDKGKPIGKKVAECTVKKESDTLYYLSVDLGDIESVPDYTTESAQFVICIFENGKLFMGGRDAPVAIVNPNPKNAPFLNLEGSETTNWATDITDYGNTNVPLIFHTVGKGKIIYNTGLDLTNGQTVANLKHIGPYMLENYGTIEFNALEGSAFQNGAVLEMYELPFIEIPDIIDDSDTHGVTGTATYSDGTLTFQVNGFTKYIAQPILSVDDLIASTSKSTITVNGTITDPQATVTIAVGGVDQGAVSVDPTTGAFSKNVNLARGSNAISVDVSHIGFDYVLTPVEKNVIRKSYSGSGTSGSSSSSSSNSNSSSNSSDSVDTDAAVQNDIIINSDGNVTIEVSKPTVNSKGEATIELSENKLLNAIEKANEGTDGVKTIQIEVPAADNATLYKPQIPAAFLTAETENETVFVKMEIKTEIADIVVPSNMLSSDLITDGKDVAISIANADTSNINPELKAWIGSKPVIELNMSIDGNTVNWSNADAPVTVSIPYSPTAEELSDPEHIVIWYIDGSGNIITVPTGRYDYTTGKVVFQVTHFSKYAIAYVKKSYDDIGSYVWAQKPIAVMSSKGIINGTSDTTYTPADSINRADFTVLLVKALGLCANTTDNFADVSPSAYYYREVGIAKKLGITHGTGDNKFDPLLPITRQDMMCLVAEALIVSKKSIMEGSDGYLNVFADKFLIAPYAVNSVAALVKSGIVVGSDDNIINPLGNTTRAEAAVILYRVYNKH